MAPKKNISAKIVKELETRSPYSSTSRAIRASLKEIDGKSQKRDTESKDNTIESMKKKNETLKNQIGKLEKRSIPEKTDEKNIKESNHEEESKKKKIETLKNQIQKLEKRNTPKKTNEKNIEDSNDDQSKKTKIETLKNQIKKLEKRNSPKKTDEKRVEGADLDDQSKEAKIETLRIQIEKLKKIDSQKEINEMIVGELDLGDEIEVDKPCCSYSNNANVEGENIVSERPLIPEVNEVNGNEEQDQNPPSPAVSAVPAVPSPLTVPPEFERIVFIACLTGKSAELEGKFVAFQNIQNQREILHPLLEPYVRHAFNMNTPPQYICEATLRPILANMSGIELRYCLGGRGEPDEGTITAQRHYLHDRVVLMRGALQSLQFLDEPNGALPIDHPFREMFHNSATLLHIIEEVEHFFEWQERSFRQRGRDVLELLINTNQQLIMKYIGAANALSNRFTWNVSMMQCLNM